MAELCKHCGERPVVTGSLPWYAEALLFLMGSGGSPGRYCADCTGGRNFIALLFASAVLLVGFVLLVIFW
jgi:hypothetical protein